MDSDSASGLLGWMRGVAKARAEGFEAYARVLLDWYAHEKYWISSGDDEVSVEALLLDSLKMVADSNLRRQIEETLIVKQCRIYLKSKEAEKAEDPKNV